MTQYGVYTRISLGRGPLVFSALCLSVLLSGSASAMPTPVERGTATSDGSDMYKVVAKSGLNVRRGPALNEKKLGALPMGTKVKVIQKDPNGWWKMQGGGKSGWVHSAYLRRVAGGATSVTGSTGNGRPSGGLAGALNNAGSTASGSTASGSTASGSTPSSSGSTSRSTSTAGSSNGSSSSVPASAAPTTGSINTGNLSGLNAGFRRKVENILRRLQAKGWQPRVAEGRRTRAQQREKVRLGYSKTMNSRHLTGNAADIIDSRYGWGGPAADTNYKFWRDLGAAAAAEGLTWGGNWRSFKDVAHVQQ